MPEYWEDQLRYEERPRNDWNEDDDQALLDDLMGIETDPYTGIKDYTKEELPSSAYGGIRKSDSPPGPYGGMASEETKQAMQDSPYNFTPLESASPQVRVGDGWTEEAPDREREILGSGRVMSNAGPEIPKGTWGEPNRYGVREFTPEPQHEPVQQRGVPGIQQQPQGPLHEPGDEPWIAANGFMPTEAQRTAERLHRTQGQMPQSVYEMARADREAQLDGVPMAVKLHEYEMSLTWDQANRQVRLPPGPHRDQAVAKMAAWLQEGRLREKANKELRLAVAHEHRQQNTEKSALKDQQHKLDMDKIKAREESRARLDQALLEGRIDLEEYKAALRGETGKGAAKGQMSQVQQLNMLAKYRSQASKELADKHREQIEMAAGDEAKQDELRKKHRAEIDEIANDRMEDDMMALPGTLKQESVDKLEGIIKEVGVVDGGIDLSKASRGQMADILNIIDNPHAVGMKKKSADALKKAIEQTFKARKKKKTQPAAPPPVQTVQPPTMTPTDSAPMGW